MRVAPDFAHATVRAATDAAADVRLITLVPDAGFIASMPGSHVDVEVPIGDLIRLRSYSVVDDRAGAWTIAVRRLEHGRGGSRFMCALQPGARLRVTPPRSHFGLSPAGPDYLFIAGGIGITPLLGMVRLTAPQAPTRLLYAGRNRAHMPFLGALDALLGDRLSVFSSGEGQRIDLARAFASLHPQGEAYLCGPPGMLAEARRLWREAGRPTALLRFETFGSGGTIDPEPFRVEVRDHGVTLDVPRDASLLDTLATAGIEIAHDCLRGECGLCAVDVVGAATIDHRCVFLSEAQRAEGHTLCACVSRAHGTITIDTGYRPALAPAHLTRVHKAEHPA